MFRLACPKGVHDNRVITYLKNEKELIDHQDFQRDPDDEGLVHYTFPGMDEDNFRYIVSQLQNQGVTMIGVDTQLTEKKIMKLTDLIKEEAANPEMSDYPNSYSADNSGWIPVSKLEQIRDEWNNKHQSGYYRDPQHRADEYMMDIEDKVYAIDGFENKISESENTSEVKAWVTDKLGLTSSFDIGIASDVVDNCWNEYWGYYV